MVAKKKVVKRSPAKKRVTSKATKKRSAKRTIRKTRRSPAGAGAPLSRTRKGTKGGSDSTRGGSDSTR